MNKFWDGILKHSWLVVAIFVIVTGVMLVGAGRIKKDSSTAGQSPEHNATVELNQATNRNFNVGRSQIFVLYAPSVFTARHLDEIKLITERLEDHKDVKKVVSLASATKLSQVDGSLISSDLIPQTSPSDSQIAEIKHFLATDFILKSGLLAASDGSSTNIVIDIDESADMPSLAAPLEKIIADTWTGTYAQAGVPTFEATGLAMMNRDVPLLSGLACLIILVVFALNFRSVFGVVLPLLQITLGLIWGAGLFGWLGLKFQSLAVIAPIAILAVGSSFTLHLLGRFFLEQSKGTPKQAAIRAVLSHTGLGVFVSGLAISAAMLTFLLSDVPMIRNFGIFSALGVGSCMVSSLTLLPALLQLLPAPKLRVKMEKSGLLLAGLRNLGTWIGRFPKVILGIGLLIVAVVGSGIFRLVPDTSALSFFKPGSPVAQGLVAVNQALGGSSTIRLVVNGDLLDPALLKAMLDVQDQARTIPGVGASSSIASLLRSLHETLSAEPALPATRELVSQELLVYQSAGSVDDITALTNLSYTQGVVTFIIPQISTREAKLMVERLVTLARGVIGGKAKVDVAGDILNEIVVEESVIHDFIISISLALMLSILIDSFIRSFRAALVTISVIAVTIVLQYGFIGLLGLPFTVATALLGALAIGVGDYAVHFTVRYMEDRKRGLPPREAVASSLSTSGRSIVFTALTIGGGFLALSFSEYMPIATLGNLMVLTVAMVGVATLVLLPAACLVFLKNPIFHMEIHANA